MASPGGEWRSVAAPVQWPPTTGVPGPIRIEEARIWCCYVMLRFGAALTDISEADWRVIRRYTNPGNRSSLALALFVAWVVLADDHDVAVAADDAAVLTHGLDARGDLH